MASAPDHLTLGRHRDLKGRERKPLTRQALVGALGLFLLFGLFNVFGQRPKTTLAEGGPASLELRSPERVRSGLLFEVRFTIETSTAIERPILRLSRGFFDGITLNTIEPSPVASRSHGDSTDYELEPLAAGATTSLYIQSQINPTTVGYRRQQAFLLDGADGPLMASIDRPLVIFP